MYSEETFNRLNYLTLNIGDPVIKQKYDRLRYINSAQTCKPLFTAILVIYVLCRSLEPYGWIELFSGEKITDLIMFIYMIVQVIANFKF